ncbi:hypothetical protein LP422_23860 [Janibacter limosus]|nr:hypothetical protein LP422_23860 [Janibacter limosus]
MDDPRGVDCPESVEHPAQDLGDEGGRERTVVPDRGGDRSSVDDRHGEEDPIVLARPPERRDHVGVLDAEGSLAHEA